MTLNNQTKGGRKIMKLKIKEKLNLRKEEKEVEIYYDGNNTGIYVGIDDHAVVWLGNNGEIKFYGKEGETVYIGEWNDK